MSTRIVATVASIFLGAALACAGNCAQAQGPSAVFLSGRFDFVILNERAAEATVEVWLELGNYGERDADVEVFLMDSVLAGMPVGSFPEVVRVGHGEARVLVGAFDIPLDELDAWRQGRGPSLIGLEILDGGTRFEHDVLVINLRPGE
jgi:hypothetical protein